MQLALKYKKRKNRWASPKTNVYNEKDACRYDETENSLFEHADREKSEIHNHKEKQCREKKTRTQCLTENVYQPNCSQWSSTPGPSDRMHAAVVLRTCVMRPSGPHPKTRIRFSTGVSSISVRIKAETSGLPLLMEFS